MGVIAYMANLYILSTITLSARNINDMARETKESTVEEPQSTGDGSLKSLKAMIEPLAGGKNKELRRRGLMYFHLRDKNSWERVANTMSEVGWSMTDFGNFAVDLFNILQDNAYFSIGLDPELLQSKNKKDIDKLMKMLNDIRAPLYIRLRDSLSKRKYDDTVPR